MIVIASDDQPQARARVLSAGARRICSRRSINTRCSTLLPQRSLVTRLSQRGVGKVNDSLSNEFFNRMDTQQTFAAPVTGGVKVKYKCTFQRPLILRIQAEYAYILLPSASAFPTHPVGIYLHTPTTGRYYDVLACIEPSRLGNLKE